MSKFGSLKELRAPKPEEHTIPVSSAPTLQGADMPATTEQPMDEPQRKQAYQGGKRNNPQYVQRTAYIRKKTDLAVKMKLLQQGGEKEFSELVDELLSLWLQEEQGSAQEHPSPTP